MKNKFPTAAGRLTQVILAAALTLLAACSDNYEDDTYIYYDLTVSDYSYMFRAAGGEHTIYVETDYTEGWKVNIDQQDDWLTIEDQTAGALILSAPENNGEKVLTATVTISAGDINRTIEFEQVPYTDVRNNMYLLPYSIQAVSPSGQYLVMATMNEAFVIEVYITDMWENETILAYTTDLIFDKIDAIADDGTHIFNSEYDGNAYRADMAGNVSVATLPAGYSSALYADISADGKVVVGSAVDSQTGLGVPVKWVDGTPTILDYPTDVRGQDEGFVDTNGVYARGVNHDGSFIYGDINYNKDGIYWKDGSQDYKFFTGIEQELVEFEIMPGITVPMPLELYGNIGMSSAGMVSPDGRYLAMHYRQVGVAIPLLWPDATAIPALFDIEKEEMIAVIDKSYSNLVEICEIRYRDDMITTYNEAQATGSSDDGLLFFKTPVPYPSDGWVYNSNDDTVTPGGLWIRNIFGVNVPEFAAVIHYDEQRQFLVGTYPAGSSSIPFYIFMPEKIR